jgi:DNA-binding IclR family transcriptional regulator
MQDLGDADRGRWRRADSQAPLAPSVRRASLAHHMGRAPTSSTKQPTDTTGKNPRSEDRDTPGEGSDSLDSVSTIAGNKATGRALLVLGALAESGGARGVSELGRELGMTKNMVHRALAMFVRHGFVVRDATGSRYQLGPGVLRLAGGGLPELDLQRLCLPAMREIRELTGETITLSVPWGRNAVIVDGIRGRGVIARRVPLGRVLPLHVSPAGRVILASFSDDAVGRYLDTPREKVAKGTLTQEADIWAEVHAIRARGYATTIGDHWLGANGIAFAVPADSPYPHGSITIGGPSERLTDAVIDGIVSQVSGVMSELCRKAEIYPSAYSEVAI